MLVLFILLLLTGHQAESSLGSSISGVPLILHNMYKETLKDTVIAAIAPC